MDSKILRVIDNFGYALGIVPFAPTLTREPQGTTQPLYIYGSQAWYDDAYIAHKFQFFRFVHRLNDELVLIDIPLEARGEDDTPHCAALLLDASTSNPGLKQ